MTSQAAQPHNSKSSIEAYARRIAATHVQDKPGDVRVFVDWTDDEVRLVEIAEHYPDSDEVLPFHFAADPERNFDYPVVIVLHSRQTWQRYEDKSTLLPEGWNFERFRPLDELGSD